jgi:hypothetical protein
MSFYHTNTLNHPEVTMKFTSINVPLGAGYVLYGDANWKLQRLDLSDCEIFGGGGNINIDMTNNITCRLQNNLFQDTYVLMFTYTDGSTSLTARNNLFRSADCSVWIADDASGVWEIKDNIFDSANSIYGGSTYLVGNLGYNAYVNGMTGDGNDIVVATFTYATGSLGRYYQSSTNCINKGSRLASATGLYHYTTQTNQTLDGSTTVDLGYHYVATDANGVPLDADGDGTSNYLEDRNGNGVVDSGETDINSATDLGLKVLITRPVNGSILP